MSSDEPRRRLLLAYLKKQREAERAALMQPRELSACRRLLDFTQAKVAKILSERSCLRYTQRDISRMELYGKGGSLQISASTLYRSLGCDVDGTGAVILIPPLDLRQPESR